MVTIATMPLADCDFVLLRTALTPVGLFPLGATPDGIHDLAGNVWEWVADWYGEYLKEKQRNPTGPERGQYRVSRGGAWYIVSWLLRAADRGRFEPVYRDDFIGFRCARDGERARRRRARKAGAGLIKVEPGVLLHFRTVCLTRGNGARRIVVRLRPCGSISRSSAGAG